MSMTFGARKSVSSEINVTPLIDVLLVLLIIFMVVLPNHHHGETADIPQPSPEKIAGDPAPILILLHDAGEGKRPDLKINGQAVAWEGLAGKLQTIYQTRAEKTAFLKGDPEIDFEFVAEAVDITHRAGAERVGLLGQQN